MRTLNVAVDWVQAGDLGYDYSDRKPLVPGLTLRAQLYLVLQNQDKITPDIGSSWSGIVAGFGAKEFISQPLPDSAVTQVIGRVVKVSTYKRYPDPDYPNGSMFVGVLLASERVPFQINYVVERLVKSKLPKPGQTIHECGVLMCEPSFYVGDLFSPIVARVVKVWRSSSDGSDLSRSYWGILSLELDPSIDRPGLTVSNTHGRRAIRL